MSKLVVCLILILIAVPVFSQIDTLSSYHILNINFGADFSKGVNLGLIIIPYEHLSVGFNYGRDVLNFVAATDQNTRYSLSLNYHGRNRMRGYMSFTFTHINYFNNSAKDYILSLNFGSQSIYERGIQFYYQFGLLLKIENNSNIIPFPNIGIGASLNIF